MMKFYPWFYFERSRQTRHHFHRTGWLLQIGHWTFEFWYGKDRDDTYNA